MRERPNAAGFYWIRFEGEPIVAELCYKRTNCALRGLHWHIPGSPICMRSAEVCQLLSARLERPRP